MLYMSKTALRVGLYGIFGFLAFVFAFVLSNIINPSLSRSGYMSDDAVHHIDFISRVISDTGINTSDGKYALLQGMIFFAIASAILNTGVQLVRKASIIGEGQERLMFITAITTPAMLLMLGLVFFDFFTDDQSLRDAQSATYLTFSRSLDVCLRLSVIAVPIVVLVTVLAKIARRREE